VIIDDEAPWSAQKIWQDLVFVARNMGLFLAEREEDTFQLAPVEKDPDSIGSRFSSEETTDRKSTSPRSRARPSRVPSFGPRVMIFAKRPHKSWLKALGLSDSVPVSEAMDRAVETYRAVGPIICHRNDTRHIAECRDASNPGS